MEESGRKGGGKEREIYKKQPWQRDNCAVSKGPRDCRAKGSILHLRHGGESDIATNQIHNYGKWLLHLGPGRS